MTKLAGTLMISRPSCSDGREVIRITVTDSNSNNEFLELEIGFEAFTRALTNEYSSDNCKFKVRGSDKIGLYRITKQVTAPMPVGYPYNLRHKTAQEACQEVLDDGWNAPTYFGTKDAFFYKDDKEYCRGIAFKYSNTPVERSDDE